MDPSDSALRSGEKKTVCLGVCDVIYCVAHSNECVLRCLTQLTA